MSANRQLPTFLGVGAQKAGTTWLHAQLQAHPEVYVPTLRKEIHFFDAYFDKGIDWYANFFPSRPAEEGFTQWGEITPKYMFDPEVADRILETLGPTTSIIVVLRDPVERFFSQYRMSYSQGDTDLDPQAFVRMNDEAFRRGLYAEQVRRFISRFGRSKVLVLFYEELFATDSTGVPRSLLEIGDFLGLSNTLWPRVDCERRVGSVGSAGRPRLAGLYRLAKKVRKWCMDKDLEGVVRLVKKTGVNGRTFGGLTGFPKIREELKGELWQAYRSDVAELERLIGKTIDFWGPAERKADQ